MFDSKVVIVTPWFGDFAGGAEMLARRTAGEFARRGVNTLVYTTCAKSPYDSWWEDYYAEDVYDVEGIETHRFATNKGLQHRDRYHEVLDKIALNENLTAHDQRDFFAHGIGSEHLINALSSKIAEGREVIALPYFQGLTHAAINSYPHAISLIPCFHDEPQFYWETTATLLENAKHIFFNSVEEKKMTLKHYGLRLGRRLAESVVAGVGAEIEAMPRDENAGDTGQHRADTSLEEAATVDLPPNFFVYLGRKERGKNVHLLCEWFARYAEQSERKTKLVLVGGGDESLVPEADCFIDLGFVSEALKRRVVQKSKGVIVLSQNESFSLALMEGWLLGVPAVVHAGCAVTKGHVSRADGGIYVDNCAEFGVALEYLETRPQLRDLLAANGRRYVAREFSFDKVLGRMLREFERERRVESSVI